MRGSVSSYPTSELCRFAESVWGVAATATRPPARSRFMSGLPAHLLARALRLSADAFALDAACASGLYAIKLACDRLHRRQADVMLAGAVNRADDLFLHAGFTALGALSRSGRSRPFHRDADGLVPAEGAAFVTLRRLADAMASGQRILGVIRACGLSNDGRAGGMLAPSEVGQARAMRAAYRQCGLRPQDISLIECHATGTAVGDAVEVRSMSTVFRDAPFDFAAMAREERIPIGSLKSNLGHLITAAGVAGLLKVLGSLARGTRLPSLHCEEPLAALRESPFRLLTAAEPWFTEPGKPRRAAVNAFGFGGNNAHLIVEEWTGEAPAAGSGAKAAPRSRVALVGLGVLAADGRDTADFARCVFSGESRLRKSGEAEGEDGAAAARSDTIQLPLSELRTPPQDLRRAVPQQLLMLAAGQAALHDCRSVPAERTAVLVGMGCDAEVARSTLRLRQRELLPTVTPEALDGICSALDAPMVLGNMPNLVANRLNAVFDLRGPSYTVSAEELSGLVALSLGAAAVASGEVDACLVGAVDLSCEPVHAAAARLVGIARPLGDAAVALVLKRHEDAVRDGDRIYALVDESASTPAAATPSALRFSPNGESGAIDLGAQLGSPHAAVGLLHVAAAALACHHGATPLGAGRRAAPVSTDGPIEAQIRVEALGGAQGSALLHAAEGSARAPLFLTAPPRLRVFAGADRQALVEALLAGREGGNGPARLCMVTDVEGEAESLRRAQEILVHAPIGQPFEENGIYLFDRPLAGDLASVFTFAATAYSGMGRDLGLALPELLSGACRRFPVLADVARRLYQAAPAPASEPSASVDLMEQLEEYSLLCQLHVELFAKLLGGRPQATIGLCTGESAALFAVGAWQDMKAMFAEIRSSGLYDRELGGTMQAVRRAWARAGHLTEGQPVEWATWRVRQPLAAVRAATAREPLCHLAIVHTPTDSLLVGEAAACRRVVTALGGGRHLGPGIAIHCPELREFAAEWRAIHDRATAAIPDLRCYSHARLAAAPPERGRLADALLAQAQQTVDFPALIEQAYADGVRVFVEHGPRGLCSQWIGEILGRREHVTVALDDAGRSPLVQALHAVAKLVAAGVPLDHEALTARLEAARPIPRQEDRQRLELPAHLAKVSLPSAAPPALPMAAQRMEPAPALPLSELWLGALSEPGLPAPAQHPVMAAHAEFLRLGTDAHTAFLASRERTLRALRGEALPVSELETPVVVPEAAPQEEPSEPKAGVSFSRAELEQLASGAISEVLGPGFAPQDRFRRQVRLPMPPLLLVDRVTRLEAEERVLGRGTVITETDIPPDAWYLHDGYIPAGLLVEAGQADLLLISWMGVDFENRGERVYRLLGCELVFHGSLPPAGSRMTYDIRVEGHAIQGNTRLFFFSHDCYVNGALRMSMRKGQAGFFSDEELRKSGGVLWDPESVRPREGGRLDPPVVTPQRRSFNPDAVRAFAAGDLYGCFGPGFELARTHVRPPRIPSGDMLFLHEISELDVTGGPWRRGYLRAVQRVTPDDWFFRCHFKDDPCMPGTLMCEACLQALAFYLTALGYSLGRDGWRFEPVSGETFQVRCRGQVVPASREVVYEVFVEEIIAGPQPTIYADILATVDGLKAFHGRRMGYRLVPDWPATSMSAELSATSTTTESGSTAAVRDGFRYDYDSLLACAWGRPSQAFGPLFRRYDGQVRIPRLPGPPYHFMSRVTAIDGACGELRVGSTVVVEYDIPEAAWYFDESRSRTLPFAVLLEAALQPCGWLAMYIGCTLHAEEELYFRNLDGTGTQLRPIEASAGVLSTHVRLTSLSRSAGVFLTGFSVESRIGQELVYRMQTVFGFFPAAALANQVGLPSPPESERRAEESALPSPGVIDLRERPPLLFEGPLRLPGARLLMLDRVTGYAPQGGRAGLGRLTAEKDIEPGEWFFKAHFFQDPVQPGSLGVQALLHLVQFYMLYTGMADGLPAPQFESPAAGIEMVWKYRGQVVPRSRKVTVEIEITKVSAPGGEPTVEAEGWLAVDGLRIYHVKRLSARIRPGRALPQAQAEDQGRSERTAAIAAAWTERLGVPSWPGAELWLALIERFVGRVELAPELAALRGRPLLLLGNHQVQVESLLFPIVAAPRLGAPIVMLASAVHRRSWVGELSRLSRSHPGIAERLPELIRYFDQTDRPSLLPIVDELRQQLTRGGASVMVHVEGRLGHSGRDRVSTISSVFIDLALAAAVPIVPVRFSGGLPVEPLAATRDFPVGYGRQDYFLGRPLWPEELRRLDHAARLRCVLAAINGEREDAQVGPGPEHDQPSAPDEAFGEAVRAYQLATGGSEAAAVLVQCLERSERPLGPELTRILRAARSGFLDVEASDGEVGQFLARLGRFLFGPRGPLIHLASESLGEERS